MGEKIEFTIIENNTKTIIQTFHGEYMNLMVLLNDKLLLEEFGECGGMGRCATCMVKISGLKGNALIKERNEPATLAKYEHNETNIRLSCQLLITKDLDQSQIEIIEH